LEGGGAVGHAKEHYQEFEQASIGPEGCLPLVSGLDMDVVEALTDIQLGEVSGSVELRYEFGDEWKKVLILDRHGIECLVVLNQPGRAVLFLDEEYRGCHRRLRRANIVRYAGSLPGKSPNPFVPLETGGSPSMTWVPSPERA